MEVTFKEFMKMQAGAAEHYVEEHRELSRQGAVAEWVKRCAKGFRESFNLITTK